MTSPSATAIRASIPGPHAAPALAGGRAFGWRDGWCYGLMGLPLAFVALPLYVVLPNYYALQFGVPLASLGALVVIAVYRSPWRRLMLPEMFTICRPCKN